MAEETKVSEARRALKRYRMVKAVLIQQVRGEGGRRNRNVDMTEKLMFSFWKGNENEVWQTSFEIKESRQKKRILQQKR